MKQASPTEFLDLDDCSRRQFATLGRRGIRIAFHDHRPRGRSRRFEDIGVYRERRMQLVQRVLKREAIEGQGRANVRLFDLRGKPRSNDVANHMVLRLY
jgi:hypothetical protein